MPLIKMSSVCRHCTPCRYVEGDTGDQLRLDEFIAHMKLLGGGERREPRWPVF
jgi:hypothetical protein